MHHHRTTRDGYLMAVSTRVRFEVLRRDGNTCRYCGASAPDVKLTVDHVVPVALGGSDDPSNLVAACVDCNAGKTSTAPDQALVADVAAVNIAFVAALKQAADELYALTEDERTYVATFAAAWGSSPVPENWKATIIAFHRAHLPIASLLEAIGIARTRPAVEDVFRYTCGIGWNRVTAIHERARQILGAPGEVDDAQVISMTWGERLDDRLANYELGVERGLVLGGREFFADLHEFLAGPADLHDVVVPF